MGGVPSDYKRGDMEIGAQKGTFGGFMDLTVYGGALIALMLLMAILTVGGVGLTWFPALIITFIVGVLVGVGLKLNATWYATIAILSILTAIGCLILPTIMSWIF